MRRKIVIFLLLSIFRHGAHGRCEGDACPEESRDAHANGLLGGAAAVQQCSRTKDYPLDGTKLKPVRFCTSNALDGLHVAIWRLS